jgi:hypothetical protein
MLWIGLIWLRIGTNGEQGNEPSGTIKCWFLEYLQNWRLFKKGSAPWVISECLLTRNVKITVCKTIIYCYFVLLWNLISYIKGRKQIEGTWDQDREKYLGWVWEGENNRRLERNYIILSYIICTPRQILLEWSSHGIWHARGRREAHTDFWWEHRCVIFTSENITNFLGFSLSRASTSVPWEWRR